MWKPNTLVIGPGGVRGFLILGALKVFEEYGLLDNCINYCGVSVGSLLIYYLTCGFNVDRILDDGIRLNFSDISKDVDISTIIEHGGIFSHKTIEIPLRKLTKEKFGVDKITFKEHHIRTGKSLTVVAFNSSEMKTAYLNHENTPDMDVIEGLLMSVSIPIVFHEIKKDENIYVDGVFGDPYPVNIYDHVDNKILGISISTIRNKDCDFLNSILRLIANMGDLLRDEKKLRSSDRVKHCVLYTEITGRFGILSNTEDKLNMISSGTDQGNVFISNIGGNNLGFLSVLPHAIPPPAVYPS